MTATHVDGGCTCGAVRFRMTGAPLFVHCCHCTWCQRESGSAFALNAMIEADRVRLLQGAVDVVPTPSASGRGQQVARCPVCHVAVWSHYSGSGESVSFVRVGTLDAPHGLEADIHIFTSTKLPWVQLPADTPAVSGYYAASKLWSAESLARRDALRAAGAH